MYQVKSINNIEQLKDCSVFPIDQYQWTNNYRPKAYGQMALLQNYGIVISMTAIESNPLRRYTKENDPVYKDSGLEAFLNFNPGQTMNYCNFEMNANGALLSQFGEGRSRKWMNELTSYRADCEATIQEDSWSVLLRIPMELICDLFHIEPLKTGDRLTCNFYKISEDPSIEHYASYAPIVNETPNFHLPEFFGEAIIG